ncbi:MAG: BLUF domain-containing protein [Alcanivoracaceae bacterium]
MYQIVYVSTATREYGKDELTRILAASRRNNSRDGVTGMLCYHGGTFFQMLEGERSRVEAVMARVEKDPRHHGVMVLLEQDVTERELPDWSMAFTQVSGRDADLLEGFSQLLKTGRDQRIDAPEAAASDALDLISGFRDTVTGRVVS